MSCYKSSDNKYFTCPSKMSDGRNFTDYRQRYKVHNLNNNQFKKSSHEYRQYLINNTNKLIKKDRFRASQKNGCFPCVEKTTMLPEETIKVCDRNTCKVLINDYDGLIKPLIIPPDLTDGTGICNPSIFVEGDKIHLILRHVEYTLYICQL